jgi:4-amino-4-deoxy-L-arabinose transferase-like glycosyltransferase
MGAALQQAQQAGAHVKQLREHMLGWTSENPWPLAPILAGVALRVALMIVAYLLTGTQIMTQGDTASYLEPARNLLLHGQYASGSLPEIDRTPGYPLFTMLTGMAFDNVLLTVLAQIAVSILSLLLVWRIAERVFPNRGAGPTAAWLFALEPISILYTIRLMPETLFVLLLLAMIDRLLSFYETGKLSTLAVSGLVLATATYVRPVSYYLVVPLAAALVITAPRSRGYRWKAPAVLLLSVLPWLAAWQLRNKIETGYSGFSSIVEQNLYFYQSAEVTAELDHISLAAEQKQLGYPDEPSYLAVHPEQKNWSATQRLHYMRSQSVQILVQHRLLYLKTHFAGVGVVAFTPCATELLQLLHLYPQDQQMPQRILNQGIISSLAQTMRIHPGVTIVMGSFELILLLYYALAICGILRGNGEKVPLILLIGIVLYFLLISGGAQAVGRYRLPVIPEVCILAAGGLSVLRSKRKAEPKGLRL